MSGIAESICRHLCCYSHLLKDWLLSQMPGQAVLEA